MSNEPNQPAEDAPKPTPAQSGASPAKPTSPSPDTPAATGPAASGPAATGPAATGPAATGPATTDPAATGPAATGPAATGPAATGPAADAGPDVPPADAERIAASEAAAASAEEPELSAPASSGLGSGAGTAGSETAPEAGAGAREQLVTGNEPVSPAGPTGVSGALPTPSADPVASSADEPASEAPAADEPSAGGSVAAPGAAAGGSAAGAAGTRPVPPADPATAQPAAPAPQPAPQPAPPTDRGSDPGGPGRQGTVRKALIVVLIVVLVGVIAYGVRQLIGGSANAEVGDCVSVSSQTDDRVDVETLDCGEDKASYKVGMVLEAADATCPEADLYTEITPASGVGDGYKLCLLPNMAEGACYKPDEGMGFVKTECTGPETIKVTKVIQGSTDLEGCPDASGMSYPEPAVTYCLEPAEV